MAQFSELGDASEEMPDYFELPSSLLAYVGTSVINVVTGKVVIDGEGEQIRGLSSFYLFPELELLTIKLFTKGGYKIYGINPLKSELKWSAQLDEASGLGQTLAEANSSMDQLKQTIQPFISANGNLVMKHRKTLVSLDPNNGKLNWTVKADAGQLLFSQGNKYIVYAENRGGIGAAMGMATSLSTEVKLSKKVNVIDASSGKSVWKKEAKMDGQVRFMKQYDGGFMVIHDEGMNIFDFNVPKGEGRWKKDLNQKGIYDVVLEEGGLMVYFKRKRQLFDPIDGKEMWKKAEKLDYDVEPYSISEKAIDENDDKISITQADTYIRVTDQTNKRSARLNADFFLDDAASKKVVAVGIANRESTTIGAPQYTVSILDLNSFKVANEFVSQKRGFYAIDKVASGYFIYGDRGFQLLTDNDGKIEILKKEHFPMPGSFTKGLTRLGIGVAGTALVTKSTANFVVKRDVGSYDSYQRKMNTIDDLGAAGINYYVPEEVSNIDNKYAYFFARDEGKELTLFQIEKNSGTEKARYVFDDKSPIYSVDYLNGKLYYMNGTTLKIYDLEQ